VALPTFKSISKKASDIALRLLAAAILSGKNEDGTSFVMPISAGLTLDPTNLATDAKQSAAASAAAVTPSDSVDLANAATKGVYVGVSGDVKIDLVTGGTAIVFKAAPVGLLRVQAKRVYATGSTATNMVALY
jgi:hypothetical protein